MKVAIMQPYFVPYIGYFQLINAVDEFVVYDNIKYTRKGWINRNRLCKGGNEFGITVPLKKGSDTLDVRDRSIAPDFDRKKILNKVREAYHCAPYFDIAFPVFETIINNDQDNLFEYIFRSICSVCGYLGIETDVKISSQVENQNTLRGPDRVIGICERVSADVYINPIGGKDLYSKQDFARHGVELRFLESVLTPYRQSGEGFVPGLSIVDVMMFNSKDFIHHKMLSDFRFAIQ